MPAAHNVLVVGAGTAGPAAAAFLADAGVNVDLIEVNSETTALGSGITLQGNALRVLRQLDVLDECLAEGWASEGMKLRDVDGSVIAEVPELRTGGPDLPASMGMYRPTLARILMARATRAGVNARFSTTLDALEQDGSGVDVRFNDGSTGRYDLVIGADGVRSPTRKMLQIPLETQSLGLGVWRVFAPRPSDVTCSEGSLGGPCYTAGVTPTSSTHLYAFLVEDAQERTALTPDEKLDVLRGLLESYHGPWDEIRESISDPTRIHYARFEKHLLDAPWHRGRVVLIGDAVHVCPPVLAQGAALGLEDASVLAELFIAADTLDDDLLNRFVTRRFGRVQTLVDTAVRLALMPLNNEQSEMVGVMVAAAEFTSEVA